MTQWEIIFLATALAIDAMIVSFSYGLKISEKKIYNSLKLALMFGFFQFIMPIIGWGISSGFYDLLHLYSKWIVFGIFTVLGIKFIFSKEEQTGSYNCITIICLLSLGIATSIDALGAGITIKFTNVKNILIPAAEIGIVTLILSMTGFWSANKLKRLPTKGLDIAGGLLLIFLGIKSLI